MRRPVPVLVLLLVATAAAEPESVPLGIDLSANDETEITLSPGTPITFVALLENVPAAEARAGARARAAAKASMDAAVAEGRMTREEADLQLTGFDAPSPADPLVVAPVADRFAWLAADGKPAPFTPTMLPAGAAAVLDGEQDLTVTFTLAPEATAAVAPGAYRLHVRYAGKGAPASEWQGTADSGEVVITVEALPAEPTTEQTWTRQHALALYRLTHEDYAKALVAADAMLAAVPASVTALVARGRAHEGLKDLAAALEDYRAALAEFRKARPDACPPVGLTHAVRRVSEALGPR